jgi:large subunit ribosomal protein L30
MAKLKITLVRSLINVLPKQKINAQALGLRKIGDVTLQNDDDSTRGKIKVLSHLISVETVSDEK